MKKRDSQSNKLGERKEKLSGEQGGTLLARKVAVEADDSGRVVCKNTQSSRGGGGRNLKVRVRLFTEKADRGPKKKASTKETGERGKHRRGRSNPDKELKKTNDVGSENSLPTRETVVLE